MALIDDKHVKHDGVGRIGDSPAAAGTRVEVNGRRYHWLGQPAVVICIDGCGQAYLDAADRAGLTPHLSRMRHDGLAGTALATMPTFTNPNNVSIVCGAPPSVHGVSGNFYLDRQSGREVMMLDAAPMRAGTILAAMCGLGVRVAVVTAKDKLRRALSRGLAGGISLSAERANEVTQAEHGIADVLALVNRKSAPDQYSADLSLFVLDAGAALLRHGMADLLYLSLSDYIQHKCAPEEQEALDFMAAIDERIGGLLKLRATVGIVADHGMSDMACADGRPNVLYLGDYLDQVLGVGAARVICPITDPFVRHHGALGGFVRVHLSSAPAAPAVEAVLDVVRTLPSIELALPRDEACTRFDLPPEPEGDIAVVAKPGVAIGAHAVDHDLSQLAGKRLRSHGGLAEREVPFLLSHPVRQGFRARGSGRGLHNYDIFDFVLNGVDRKD